MPRIKVMVVDDSVVIRRMLTDLLAAEPDIEVVGHASNGKIALAKLPQLAPDLVTLDIEMPEMDGLETVREIRKQWRHLPVIMFSTLSERGAQATLEALSAGATDYVTKPSNSGSMAGAQEKIRDQLIPKIRHLGARAQGPTRPALVPPSARPTGLRRTPLSTRAVDSGESRPAGGAGRPTPTFTRVEGGGAPVASKRPRPAAGTGDIDIVAIGCSTGGPNALVEIIPKLSATFAVPIVITQHMPPLFTKFLADRLTALSKIPVIEVAGGEVLRPGTAYLAPGDHHLVLEKQGGEVVATLTQTPPENSVRPAVDVMLRSAVACYDRRVLSVILTGMGQDGLHGCELVHEVGGRVIAQDEESSVVWGMPGFVARAGIAEAVVPLAAIADAISERVEATGARRMLRSHGTGH